MKRSISSIKESYAALKTEELQIFIEEFSDDGRKAVQELIERAKRRLSALEKEKLRMHEMFRYEREAGDAAFICGIDEVGRGPLAGPVMAAAVILPKDCGLLYINDSKKLTAAKREELSKAVRSECISFGIGRAEPERIDEINILQAVFEAMSMAVKKLSVKPDILLNDAVRIPGLDIPQVPIIKGDQKSASIAAASIVAKVERDSLMDEFDRLYPGYGFSSNKGYGTKEHIEALKRLGPSPIHRKSFIGHFINNEDSYK